MRYKFFHIPLLSLFVFAGLLSSCNSSGHRGNTAQTITAFDSAAITGWDVIPRGERANAYSVFKDSNLYWQVKMPDHKVVDASINTISRSLKHLSHFKTLQKTTLDKSKWKEEGIDDKGTLVKVYVKNAPADSFYVGNLSFVDQNKASYYIRDAANNNIYRAIEMYLEGSVIAPPESFRKREMTGIDYHYFKSVKIQPPGAHEYYIIERLGGEWLISGQSAFQDKVNQYVHMLSLVQIPAFVTPSFNDDQPVAAIDIKTPYGPIKLIARQTAPDTWILASSVNVGNYLKLNTAQVNAIFPPRSQFINE